MLRAMNRPNDSVSLILEMVSLPRFQQIRVASAHRQTHNGSRRSLQSNGFAGEIRTPKGS